MIMGMTRDEETRQMNQEVINHKDEIKSVLDELYASLTTLRTFSNNLLQEAETNLRIRALMPNIKEFLEFNKINGEEMLVVATVLSDWAVKSLKRAVDEVIADPNGLCMCVECVQARGQENGGVAVAGVFDISLSTPAKDISKLN